MRNRQTASYRRATFLLLILGWMPLLAQAAAGTHVILISIDGLAASYLPDPKAALPTLRRLAAEGCVAQAMHVSNPSTTWPNHTALVTGVNAATHAVLFNGKLVRGGPGQPVTLEGNDTQSELVAVPALYDRVHQAGGQTAAINWPCTRGALNLNDNFPDTPDPISNTTRTLRAELIRNGILEDASDASFLKKGAAGADQAWTAAALHLLQERPPQLLLLHLLATDEIQHRYGPHSLAAYAALALADSLLTQLIGALDTDGLRKQTTVFIVSDHGFAKPVKLISPNVLLRKAGLQRPGRRRAQVISQGGTAFLYLTQPKQADEDAAKVREVLGGLEGLATILEPAQFGPLGLPTPERNPQMADLLLVAKEGYCFSDEALDDEAITSISIPVGCHGYLSSDRDMDGIFIAWGHGIRPRVKLPAMEIVDVAPTIATLLGVDMPGTEGKVLTQILSPKRKSE